MKLNLEIKETENQNKNKNQDNSNYQSKDEETALKSLKTAGGDGGVGNSGVELRSGGLIFDNRRFEKEWLTTKEAAEYLRISAKCLLNLTSSGRVPYFKFGRRNRFLLGELRRILLADAKGGSHGN